MPPIEERLSCKNGCIAHLDSNPTLFIGKLKAKTIDMWDN